MDEEELAYGIEALPDFQRRERLALGLARIVRAAGWERFVCATILEPTSEHFPDRFTPTRRGVKRLIRRLLAHAGLGDHRIDLATYDGPSSEHGAAAYFAGIREGRIAFGLDVTQLGDPEQLVAVLCHEVAHAFRTRHRLEVLNQTIEEALTDVTTVYLGFGLLTTNGAYRYRSEVAPGGMTHGHQWSHRRAGYLTAAEMSFLLGLHSVSRGTSDAELRRLRRQIEPAQRWLFDETRRLLGEEPIHLAALSLPPSEQWPAPASLPELGEDDEDDEDDEQDLRAVDRPLNAGGTTMRVRDTRMRRGLALGMLGAVAFAAYMQPPPTTGLAVLLVATVVGAILGSRFRADTCADRGCEAPLPLDAEVCPRCHGAIER